MIHPGAEFLSISGLVKLENKLSAPKIQLWDRYRITAVDVPISKGRELLQRLSPGGTTRVCVLK